MKKTIISLVTSAILISPSIAMAIETVSPTLGTRRQEKVEQLEQKKTEIQAKKTATIVKRNQTNAEKEISRRLDALNKLLEKVGLIKNLSQTTRLALATQIKNEIAKLTALQTQFESTDDINELKTLRQSIITEYRTFALYIPKITILAHADSIITVVNLIKEKSTDVKVLADAEDALNLANEAIKKVESLTPADFPTKKTDLNEARDLLKQARLSLAKVRKILSSKPSVTPSAKPTIETEE